MNRFLITWSALFVTALLACAMRDGPAYSAEPNARSIGCFADNKNADPLGIGGRDLDGSIFKDHAMTATKCVSLCRDQGFRYAGLQDGSWCFCGNSYGRYKNGAANCKTPCAGDATQTCGGEWANSVWELAGSQAAEPQAVPAPSASGKGPAFPAAPDGAQATQRFDQPKLGGIRLDSRPAQGRGFDVVGVAHSYCQRMGFSRMLDYRVADAGQTIAIEDSSVFTNNRSTNTTYRFIVCGP